MVIDVEANHQPFPFILPIMQCRNKIVYKHVTLIRSHIYRAVLEVPDLLLIDSLQPFGFRPSQSMHHHNV